MTETSNTKTNVPKGIFAVLAGLDFIFILNTLLTQAFMYGFNEIGEAINMPQNAAIIVSIPGIVLGVVCFIYASLSDYIDFKKMVIAGVTLFLAGSVLGFLFHTTLWSILLARCLQIAGGQVAGSIYLAIAARYVSGPRQVTLFGVFTASYQLSFAIGVLTCGYLTSIDWSLLFLVPVLCLPVLPVILGKMPKSSGNKGKVDILGFLIFGVAITMLSLFFTYGVYFLIASAVLFVIFAVYINKAKSPFVTPVFFKNTRWLCGISLILVLWFIAFSITSLFNTIGQSVFKLDTVVTGYHLVFGSFCACGFAVFSGAIVAKIGRSASLVLACVLQVVGLVVAGIFCGSSMLVFTIGICIYFAGFGLVYSPLSTMVLGTLSQDEMGRGIGMNDLSMNIAGSIGISVFGSVIAAPQNSFLSNFALFGATPEATAFTNLLLLYALISLVGLILFFCFRKHINPQEH